MKTLSIKVFCLLVFGCLGIPIVYVGIVYLIAWLWSDAVLAVLVMPFLSRVAAYAACAYLLKDVFSRHQLLKSTVSAVALVELFATIEMFNTSFQTTLKSVRLACSQETYSTLTHFAPCVEQAYSMWVLFHLKFWLLPILCVWALVAFSRGLNKRQQITQ